ncbi:MAG: hypothetical protein ACLQVM_24885 [Terriglobia bacterium]
MTEWQNAKPGIGKQWQTTKADDAIPEMAVFRASQVGCPSRRIRQAQEGLPALSGARVAQSFAIAPGAVTADFWNQKGSTGAAPPAFPVFLGKGLDVLLPGPEEIQKVHPGVLAGLAKAQQNQVVSEALLGGDSPNNLAKGGESFDGVFGVIVVPRDPVEAQKCASCRESVDIAE